ncbi:hypothetical protein BDW75DRAFT_242921 [Aspergillus navahoensis]
MHLPRASWLLAACMGALTTAAPSSVLEVDLTFPHNRTYRPAEWFPIVFAFQNPERAKYLNLEIIYKLWNLDDRNNSLTRSHDLRLANWTSHEPYFAYEDDQNAAQQVGALWSSCLLVAFGAVRSFSCGGEMDMNLNAFLSRRARSSSQPCQPATKVRLGRSRPCQA